MKLNPTVAIAHVLAIALGVWGGWTLIASASPDLPSNEVEPGVSAASDPTSVDGSDAGSLLRPGPLKAALDDLDDQIAAGDGVTQLTIEAGELHATTGSGDRTLDPAEIPADAPSRIVAGAAKQQPRIDLDHVRVFVLVAGKGGGTWHMELIQGDPQLPPPLSYFAPLDGRPVAAGGKTPPYSIVR